MELPRKKERKCTSAEDLQKLHSDVMQGVGSFEGSQMDVGDIASQMLSAKEAAILSGERSCFSDAGRASTLLPDITDLCPVVSTPASSAGAAGTQEKGNGGKEGQGKASTDKKKETWFDEGQVMAAIQAHKSYLKSTRTLLVYTCFHDVKRCPFNVRLDEVYHV